MTEKIQPLKNQKELLNLVFPESAFSYEYLEWLYHSGPDGHHIPSDYSETEELLGHYTVVPQTWRDGQTARQLALSLNTAVHEKARGKGLFTKLAEESYAEAAEQGIQAIIGVANANSTPGFLRRLGFKLVCPLPVVAGMAFPAAWGRVASHRVTPQFLKSSEFDAVRVAILAGQPTTGLVQNWTTEKLHWRLSSPRAKYALHTHSTGTLITTAAPLAAGIRAVIALKFFPHSSHQIDCQALLRKATAFHRSPFFIYSGFNDLAKLRGLPLPRRLLPSPLSYTGVWMTPCPLRIKSVSARSNFWILMHIEAWQRLTAQPTLVAR
ncbi:GNAT family N-acetyltransferase [Ralstonia pseudosolanacearum]|uniref:GNAT family N-acetyltransferase n=1 Tax=Ralstonia pseudosolanacearum TaxID=1310165 RepID=UPI003D2CD905